MWELDHKEGWAPKNWCFQTVMPEKTLESPGLQDQTRRSTLNSLQGLMLTLKLQYFGPLMWRAAHWKRPWCWERSRAGEKGTTEDEMVGWHHQLHGHEFEQAPGDGEEQGSLAGCGPWGWTWLNNNKTIKIFWNFPALELVLAVISFLTLLLYLPLTDNMSSDQVLGNHLWQTSTSTPV